VTRVTEGTRTARPDTDRLLAVLSDLTGRRGLPRPVRIVHRRTNAYASTFPSETIECECDDGSIRRYHAKFQAGRAHADHGHRRDLAYEGAVYEELVCPVGLSMPQWIGAHDDEAGDVWLFIEHLERAVELDEMPRPEAAIVEAARWIARFHAWHDRRGDATASVALTRYDASYYSGWIGRTLQFAGPWRTRLSWLDDVARRSERLLRELNDVPPTVIHGEFTPSNVLVIDGLAYPIDWESAAIAPGEIDVVCLTDKWPDDLSHACVAAYAATRWPEGPPADLDRRFDLARVYWDLRWLGDRPEWTGSEKVGPRFEHLRASVARLTDTEPS
jgi:Phosphotransferase enzyme family